MIRSSSFYRFGAFGVLAFARVAHASNVTELPDMGSEQMGRGGAWVARASDPMATFLNPAGLAGQATRVTLQANAIIQHTCFTRVQSAIDQTVDPLVDPTTKAYPRVCNDISPQLSPDLAMTLRLNDRIGLGFGVFAPNTSGTMQWPDFESGQASPSRYLLSRANGVVVFPTIGIGAEIFDRVRVGAAVSWGMAKLKLASAVVGLNQDGAGPDNDVRANVQVADYFVPGFTLGTIVGVTDSIDIGASYKFSDSIRARGDVGTAANYYTPSNAKGDSSKVAYGDSIFEDCGTGSSTKVCGSGDNASLRFAIPMEAKLGVRFHKDRPSATAERDPLKNELFDVELNVTWANNSAIDAIQIRFPDDGTGNGNGIVPVSGTGGSLPPNADQVKGFKDVFGVRLGGDLALLPDTLAVRAGAFFETNGQDNRYQHVDFVGTTRFGFGVGGTYRLRFGESSRALEFMLGYGHVAFADATNNDPNGRGIPAIAGTQCNPAAAPPGESCPNGNLKYRTNWPVNLGTITSAANLINVGVAYRF